MPWGARSVYVGLFPACQCSLVTFWLTITLPFLVSVTRPFQTDLDEKASPKQGMTVPVTVARLVDNPDGKFLCR